MIIHEQNHWSPMDGTSPQPSRLIACMIEIVEDHLHGPLLCLYYIILYSMLMLPKYYCTRRCTACTD